MQSNQTRLGILLSASLVLVMICAYYKVRRRNGIVSEKITCRIANDRFLLLKELSASMLLVLLFFVYNL